MQNFPDTKPFMDRRDEIAHQIKVIGRYHDESHDSFGKTHYGLPGLTELVSFRDQDESLQILKESGDKLTPANPEDVESLAYVLVRNALIDTT